VALADKWALTIHKRTRSYGEAELPEIMKIARQLLRILDE
jgi:hypothetical protein